MSAVRVPSTGAEPAAAAVAAAVAPHSLTALSTVTLTNAAAAAAIAIQQAIAAVLAVGNPSRQLADLIAQHAEASADSPAIRRVALAVAGGDHALPPQRGRKRKAVADACACVQWEDFFDTHPECREGPISSSAKRCYERLRQQKPSGIGTISDARRQILGAATGSRRPRKPLAVAHDAEEAAAAPQQEEHEADSPGEDGADGSADAEQNSDADAEQQQQHDAQEQNGGGEEEQQEQDSGHEEQPAVSDVAMDVDEEEVEPSAAAAHSRLSRKKRKGTKDVGAAAAGTKASKKSTAVQASRERDSKKVMKKPKDTLKDKNKAKKLQRAISDDDEEASAGHDSGSDSHDRGNGSGNDSDAAGAAAAAPAAIEDKEDSDD